VKLASHGAASASGAPPREIAIMLPFGSPKTRRLGVVIAALAIIFLILVLMFGQG